LPAFLLVLEGGEAVLVPEMGLEPACPPVPACNATRMLMSSSINLQRNLQRSLYNKEKRGGEVKETEHHKMAGGNADELTSYFLAIRKRPLLSQKCFKNREKETVLD